MTGLTQAKQQRGQELGDKHGEAGESKCAYGWANWLGVRRKRAQG